MFKAIFDFFFGPSSPKPNLNLIHTVLFDYKKFPVLYLSRCKLVLGQMVECGLVEKLASCKSVEDFGSPERFNSYDLADVEFAGPMLKKICENPNEINVNTDEELKQISKIVMKKYLMNEFTNDPKPKVSIQVQVPGLKKIQVVSYANENKDGTPKLKDPGGTIESGETPLCAGIREVEEELGLIVKDLQFVEEKYNTHKYLLVLNEAEYWNYSKQVNQLDIDPEITMIAVTEST